MDCGSVQGLMEEGAGENAAGLSTPRKQWQLSIEQHKAYHGRAALQTNSSEGGGGTLS
jgi:hypothetical protein